MPYLTSVPIPFGSLASTILVQAATANTSFPRRRKEKTEFSVTPVSFRSSTSSTTFPESPLSQSMSSLAVSSGKSTNANSNKLDPSANWPPAFDHDFTSRLWLTYGLQFSIPIRDMRLGDLSMTDNWEGVACLSGSGSSPVSAGKRSWPWGGGEKTWNSDSGWGCMLRTGQSLLANALVYTHLGRGMSHARFYMCFF
jgi:cysteine protease ATG4